MNVIKTTTRSDFDRRAVCIIVIACAFTVVARLAAVFA